MNSAANTDRPAAAIEVVHGLSATYRLRATCLVRSWPSLGITADRPLWALKRPDGKVAAQGRDAAALRRWARVEGATVRGEFI